MEVELRRHGVVSGENEGFMGFRVKAGSYRPTTESSPPQGAGTNTDQRTNY